MYDKDFIFLVILISNNNHCKLLWQHFLWEENNSFTPRNTTIKHKFKCAEYIKWFNIWVTFDYLNSAYKTRHRQLVTTEKNVKYVRTNWNLIDLSTSHLINCRHMTKASADKAIACYIDSTCCLRMILIR